MWRHPGSAEDYDGTRIPASGLAEHRRSVGVLRVNDETALESDLLDVTDISFEQLDALPDSVLRASLRRVLSERVDVPERYTIFQNSM